MIEKQHQLINFIKSSLLHKPTLSFMSATKKPKGFSFSAFFFFFSLFIFLSLSRVPPSTLFKDTNFWFILSNAIILTIAADSGAFSLSEQKLKHDLYEEYLINSRARSSSTTTAPPLFLDSHTYKVSKEAISKEEEAQEEEKLMTENAVVDDDQTVEVSNGKDMNIGINSKKVVISAKTSEDEEKGTTTSNLCRSKTEKLEKGSDQEEVDEFSAMSVEELNKRFEEFIQKFNREIRHQETKNYILG